MLQLVSGAMSLASGIMGSSSAKKAAKNKARIIRKMADYNAKVKEMEARSVVKTMGAETTRAYKDKRRAMASQRAAYAKSGAVSSGTPMAVLLEQATEMEMDIQNQRRNRLLEEQNLKQQAKTGRYEGEMQAQAAIAEGKAQARASLLGGIAGAVGGIGGALGGIAQAGGKGGLGAGFSKLGAKALLQ